MRIREETAKKSKGVSAVVIESVPPSSLAQPPLPPVRAGNTGRESPAASLPELKFPSAPPQKLARRKDRPRNKSAGPLATPGAPEISPLPLPYRQSPRAQLPRREG